MLYVIMSNTLFVMPHTDLLNVAVPEQWRGDKLEIDIDYSNYLNYTLAERDMSDWNLSGDMANDTWG